MGVHKQLVRKLTENNMALFTLDFVYKIKNFPEHQQYTFLPQQGLFPLTIKKDPAVHMSYL